MLPGGYADPLGVGNHSGDDTEQNRWNLNIEGVLSFQKQEDGFLRIFVSEHKWKDAKPTEEETLMMLNQGGRQCHTRPRRLHIRPRHASRAEPEHAPGPEASKRGLLRRRRRVLDRAYPGHRLGVVTILHFWPPAARIDSVGDDEGPPLRGNAAGHHPPNVNQHANSMPKEASMAMNGCRRQRIAMCGGIRLHGL